MINVLIVDDDPLQLLYLSATLGKLDGIQIEKHTSANKALARCAEKTWDLVLLDYQMPDLHGLDFVARLRELDQHQETPLLMVTASSDPVIKHQMLGYGTVDFLQKPIDAIELQARARNLIQLHKATQQLKFNNKMLHSNVEELAMELQLREHETLLVMARAAEFRDSQTGSHLTRMAEYSRLIARNLNLNEDLVEKIYLAAPMHDVGKIGIPDHILHKPAKLDPDEWTEMKRHTQYGYDILGKARTPVLRLGGEIALCHHEAWNGSGYPRGINGEAIPISARIVSVADIFDALTTKRPYKEAWTMAAALDELNKLSGQTLDPACVQGLMNSLDQAIIIMESNRDAV